MNQSTQRQPVDAAYTDVLLLQVDEEETEEIGASTRRHQNRLRTGKEKETSFQTVGNFLLSFDLVLAPMNLKRHALQSLTESDYLTQILARMPPRCIINPCLVGQKESLHQVFENRGFHFYSHLPIQPGLAGSPLDFLLLLFRIVPLRMAGASSCFLFSLKTFNNRKILLLIH